MLKRKGRKLCNDSMSASASGFSVSLVSDSSSGSRRKGRKLGNDSAFVSGDSTPPDSNSISRREGCKLVILLVLLAPIVLTSIPFMTLLDATFLLYIVSVRNQHYTLCSSAFEIPLSNRFIK